MTVPMSSSSLGPQPQVPKDRFLLLQWLPWCRAVCQFTQSSCLLQRSHSPHWEWVPVVFYDNSKVTPPHSFMTFANLPCGAPSKGPTWGVCRKSAPSCRQFWPLPPLCLSRWGNPQLLTPDQSWHCLTETHCLSWTPWCPCWHHLHWWPQQSLCHGLWCCQRPPLPPIIGVSSPLGWTGEGVSELRPRVVMAAASFWLGSIVGFRLSRWKDALAAGTSSHVLSMSSLVMSVIRCTIRRAILLLVPGIDGEHEE